MKEKLARFCSSYLGHIMLAFVCYCLFLSLVLLSLNVIIPHGGLNQLSNSAQVTLAENVGNEDTDTAGLRHIKIAIVLGEMGLSDKTTKKAVEELPGGISFAFSPYADDLDNWFAESRKYGHDLLLEIPMEPENYPNNDPGPASLLTRYSDARNLDMLDEVLRKAHGYSGITPWLGNAFMTSTEHIEAVLKHLKKTELYFLDRTDERPESRHQKSVKDIAKANHLPYVGSRFVLDKKATREHILAQLDLMETSARIGDGYAVAFAQAYPVTINALKEWEKSLVKKNISLVPMSMIAQYVFAKDSP